ncbi:MAG: peptidylprolyl isomerase [Mariniblastus sp.]|nr:peptidylprolyl isomerase [Mariniblastus sp.]
MLRLINTSHLRSAWLIKTCLIVTATAFTTVSNAQELEKASPQRVQELRSEFDAAILELKDAIKAIKKTGTEFYENKSTVAHEYRSKWKAEAVVAQDAYKRVREVSFALFFETANPGKQVNEIVSMMNQDLIAEGQLAKCYRTTKKLLQLYPENKDLYNLMGRVSILNNDFDFAQQYYQANKQTAEQLGVPEGALYGNSMDKLATGYERELALRASDAAGEPLPRAIIKTNRGEIVIELFENQAPETVGNFVSLVQTGIYDGMIFHHVLKNLIADTGLMTLSRPQPVGYTIFDEHQKPNARHHFRGSVAMVAKNNEPNSAGAEFRIMLVPGPNLDGNSTVFGRVISDMSILDNIQETFQMSEEEDKEEFIKDAKPDVIESITVTNLRDHEYEPNRVKNK